MLQPANHHFIGCWLNPRGFPNSLNHSSSAAGSCTWEVILLIMLLDDSNEVQWLFPLLVADCFAKRISYWSCFKFASVGSFHSLYVRETSFAMSICMGQWEACYCKSVPHLYFGHPLLSRISLISPQNKPGTLFFTFSPSLHTLMMFAGRSSNSSFLHSWSSCWSVEDALPEEPAPFPARR